MFRKNTLITFSISLMLGMSSQLQASQETDELRRLIEQQQQQLRALKKRLDENEQKITATAEVIEQKISTPTSNIPSNGTTSLGGYGEIHYSNNTAADQIDFHRFVLFVNHKFSDKLRFYSELELEHALSANGEPGEVELEQGFIEYDVNQNVISRAGLFLVPVGIINETHEPTTFYGVERNPVENNIIPTTWREGGVSVNFRFAEGWSLDTAVTSGLNVPLTGINAYKIRKGRTNVAEAAAENLAFTGRLKFTGIAGLEFAASYQFQDDITQGKEGVSANLFSAHAIYQNNAFMLKALYASWDLNSVLASASGRDKQRGYYIEPSYKINEKLGVFARFNQWDNEAGDAIASNKKQTTIGMNYWLHPDVVLKADWDNFSGAIKGNGFNLGMGYQF